MKNFILFLFALVCFSPHTFAETHIMEETSMFFEVDSDYSKAEQQAYEDVLEKIAEHSTTYVEFLQKNKDEAFGESVAIKTMATVQRVLEKNYIYQGNSVACHLKVEIDDELLRKALDKAKVTAEKELYHEEANMNGRERDAYKEQSTNPTSLKDTDYENLLKQAKQAYLQKRYSHCIQYAQQAENASMYAKDQKFQQLSLSYLAIANAKIGNFYEAIGFADKVLENNPNSVYALYAKQISNFYLGNQITSQEYAFKLLPIMTCGSNVKIYPLLSVDEVYFYTCYSYIKNNDKEYARKLVAWTPYSTGNQEMDIKISLMIQVLSHKIPQKEIDSDTFINYFVRSQTYDNNMPLVKNRLQNLQFDKFFNQAFVHLQQGYNSNSVEIALKHFRIAYAITKQYPEEYEYKLIAKEILTLLKSQYVQTYPDCIRFVTGEVNL